MNKNYIVRLLKKEKEILADLIKLEYFQNCESMHDGHIMIHGKWFTEDMENLRMVLFKHNALPVTVDVESDSYEKGIYKLTTTKVIQLFYKQYDTSCDNCGEFYTFKDDALCPDDSYCPNCQED